MYKPKTSWVMMQAIVKFISLKLRQFLQLRSNLTLNEPKFRHMVKKTLALMLFRSVLLNGRNKHRVKWTPTNRPSNKPVNRSKSMLCSLVSSRVNSKTSTKSLMTRKWNWIRTNHIRRANSCFGRQKNRSSQTI